MAFKMKAGKEGPMKKNFPNVFKKLRDYQVRDGELIPISTEEYDRLAAKKGSKQTLTTKKVKSTKGLKEGDLVSDLATGEKRIDKQIKEAKTDKEKKFLKDIKGDASNLDVKKDGKTRRRRDLDLQYDVDRKAKNKKRETKGK